MKKKIAKNHQNQKFQKFSEKINKIKTLLVMLTKNQMQKTHITKIRNESGAITSDLPETKMIREYYAQLHANKLDSLDETDTFLGTYNPSIYIQEEIENLGRLITSKDIKSLINYPTKKSLIPDGFTLGFFQTCKELTILFKFFQNIEEEGIFPNSFYEVSIMLESG